jgi:acetyl esterase
MPLHPQAKAALKTIAALGGRPIEEMTPEVRAERAKNAGAMAAMWGPIQEVARVENRTIPGPGGPIPIRVYWPEMGRTLPVLVYFHGGGWVFGNMDSVDRPCRVLANEAPCIVVNVDYRLAPEHRFPAAVEDSFAAVQHIAEHAGEVGADGSRIAVGGESAGGNPATVACLMAREQDGPPIVFQLLVYPMTNYDDDSSSLREYRRPYVDARNDSLFLGPLRFRTGPGSPPVRFATTSQKPRGTTASDGHHGRVRSHPRSGRSLCALSAGIRRAGEIEAYEGAIYVFFQMAGVMDVSKQAQADAAAALRQVFWPGNRAVA